MIIHIILLVSYMCGTQVFGQSAIQEIRNPLIRHTIRVVASAVYDSTGISVEREVRRGYPGQPSASTILEPQQLEKFFNDGERSLGVNYNSFEAGKVKGHLFSVNHKQLNNKIFIGFPGSQDGTAWNKNLFRIAPAENIQGAYRRDIDSIFEENEMSFPRALERHIRALQQNSLQSSTVAVSHDPRADGEPIDYSQYEYYFVGHSRGGGLALLAAEKFKEQIDRFELGKIKVFTFSSPRLSNAFNRQLDFVRNLGFENIVHFIRPFDVGPLFPFRFVENYGVKVPLIRSRVFLNLLGSHTMPDSREIDDSIKELTVAKNVGWVDPVLSLFFPIEPKSLIWGICGFSFGCVATAVILKTGIAEDIATMLYERQVRGY